MHILPAAATDDELVSLAHLWATRLEACDYRGALAMTDHDWNGWTPEVLRECIERYGDAVPGQRVTVAGVPSDVSQRICVTRWGEQKGAVGELWYDLNINGVASDLTATFYLTVVPDGLVLSLSDVRVM
jgi:hypothetical protein